MSAEDVLVALGFCEASNYSFVPDEMLALLGEDPQRYVEILNPIAVNASRIRREGAPSLLGNLPDNLRREERVALFEIGKGYELEHLNERAEPRERHWIAAMLATSRARRDDPGARFAGAPTALVLCGAHGLAFHAIAGNTKSRTNSSCTSRM